MSDFLSEFVTECWNTEGYNYSGSSDKPWARPIFDKKLFKKGEKYRCVIITRNPLLYGVFPHNSKVIEHFREEYFNRHFYSLTKLRKLKLEKINESGCN